MLLAVGRPGEIRGIHTRALRAVEEDARHVVLVSCEAGRGKEPQSVCLDRPANRHVEIVETQYSVWRRQAARAEIIGQVITLEVPWCRTAERRAVRSRPLSAAGRFE